MDQMTSAPADAAPADVNAQPAPAQAPEPQGPADLDGISEFKFQGRSYTPQALAKLIAEREQYEQTVKTSGQYKEYAANLKIDLAKVAKSPELAEQFKELYPPEFHHLVDMLSQNARPAAPSATSENGLPKEFLSEFDAIKGEISALRKERHTAAVRESEAYLQKVVDPLFEKYPYANNEYVRDAVLLRAEQQMQQGYQMTPASWERFVKEAHLASKKHFEGLSAQELKQQLDAGKQARDTGPGGAPPGQAPKRAQTWDEAIKEAERQMKAASGM